jgi:3-oxoacyl-[acyl-carrier protein] reductase
MAPGGGWSLRGKAAIVTGASRGIGRALAIGLARSGANVVVGYSRDQAGADATCETIHRADGAAVAIRADVSRHEDARRLVELSGGAFGRVDVLVNAAARPSFGRASAVTVTEWDATIATNVRGPFFLSLAAAQVMGDGGAIINVSSLSATLMIPFHSAYTAGKAALEAVTRQLALELAPSVRVNAVAPGATLTERNTEHDREFGPKWAEVTPLGRVAEPEDYVGAVVFLASGASQFMTGQVLHVDGGWTIKGEYPRSIPPYDIEQRD